MFIVIAGLLILAAAGLLAYRTPRKKAVPDPASGSGEWLAAFSVDKYRPMLRLFNSGDREWLEMQPGYDSRCVRRLTSERATVFAEYLRAAGRDGRRLHAAAWRLAASAQDDATNLGAFIAWQVWTLEFFLVRARLRLAVARLAGGAVDPRPVFNSLDALARAVKLAARPVAAVK